MAFVNREDGNIVTAASGFSPGIAEEEIADDDAELLAFLNPPASSKKITRRQLRLTLVRRGISLSSVEGLIDAIPDDLQRQEAQIEWADASEFERHHPTLILIANALGLSDAEIDEMWEEAETA